MSIQTVTQMHEDLRQLSQKNAQQFSEPGTLSVFNSNLLQAKNEYPEDEVLAAVPNAVGQVRIGDLFIRVGQLKAVLEANTPIMLG